VISFLEETSSPVLDDAKIAPVQLPIPRITPVWTRGALRGALSSRHTHTCSVTLARANWGHDTRALRAYLEQKHIQHTVRYSRISSDIQCFSVTNSLLTPQHGLDQTVTRSGRNVCNRRQNPCNRASHRCSRFRAVANVAGEVHMRVKTVAVVLVLLAAGAVSWRSSAVLAVQCTNSLSMPQSGLDQTGTSLHTVASPNRRACRGQKGDIGIYSFPYNSL